jgi:hypothetical protein
MGTSMDLAMTAALSLEAFCLAIRELSRRSA